MGRKRDPVLRARDALVHPRLGRRGRAGRDSTPRSRDEMDADDRVRRRRAEAPDPAAMFRDVYAHRASRSRSRCRTRLDRILARA